MMAPYNDTNPLKHTKAGVVRMKLQQLILWLMKPKGEIPFTKAYRTLSQPNLSIKTPLK